MFIKQTVRAMRGVRTYASLYTELTTPNGITYKQPTGLFIGGKFVGSKSGKTFEVTSPSTRQKIVDVQEADSSDVDAAVDAAEPAAKQWANYSPYERGRILSKIADLIEQNAKTFTAVETWDNGKPLSQASSDVDAVIQVFRYYAGWADKIDGRVVITDVDHFNYTVREPLGVTGAVIPWNFPFLMLSWKVAPALCTGNAVVLKSAESTPLTVLIFAGLLEQVEELPKGVVNVLSGYGSTGAAISSHPRIKKIAFTGSSRTGRKIMESAAQSNLKKVTLELGGKSPNIVFDDADFETAIKATLFGIFYNQGEVCCAGTRLLVQEGIHDKFVAELVKEAENLKVGDPFDPASSYGAQTNESQYNIVLNFIESGKKQAKLVTGGGKAAGDGYFIQPTIFTDAPRDARIFKEEIFGPVLSVVKFKTVEEALEIANDTEYGLASGVHTSSLEKAIYVASKLEAGSVWVNTYNAIHQQMPFGGYKTSGIGRELGSEVLQNYLETKSVRIANISRAAKL